MNTRVFGNDSRNDPRAAQSRPEHAADQHYVDPGDGDASVRHGERQQATTAPLFPSDVCRDLESRWMQIQTEFVDMPRESVRRADALVSDTIRRLADSFAQERSRLETQWSRADGSDPGRASEVSTEDLRVALTRYRSFFQRLLHL